MCVTRAVQDDLALDDGYFMMFNMARMDRQTMYGSKAVGMGIFTSQISQCAATLSLNQTHGLWTEWISAEDSKTTYHAVFASFRSNCMDQQLS